MPYYYSDKGNAGKRGVHYKYDIMTDEEIYDIKILSICEKDTCVFVWTTAPKIPITLNAIQIWGLQYRTWAFVWNKTFQTGSQFMGMGNWTRSNTEICLLATLGNPERESAAVEQVINEHMPIYMKTVYNGIHSKKPDAFRTRIVELCGDKKRIELFAREKVAGWDSIGNELDLAQRPLFGYDYHSLNQFRDK